MKGSYFVPKEKLAALTGGGAMNSQEGIYLYGYTEPGVTKLLPPPLEAVSPDNPVFYLYIVNIREPTFAPWYMEGGIGLLAKYGEKTGVYFFSLQLSGPGALMGAFTGREGSGLPKKLCEKIVVERTDGYGHCRIERKGVRLVDVELEMGCYNSSEYSSEVENCQNIAGGVETGGGCLLHKYRRDVGGIRDMELIFYDSPTRYYSWEPASASVRLASSIDDPWGEIPLVGVLGAAWAKCDNRVQGTSVIYRYPQDRVDDTMQYLFTGRYDRSIICDAHQHYE